MLVIAIFSGNIQQKWKKIGPTNKIIPNENKRTKNETKNNMANCKMRLHYYIVVVIFYFE